MKKFNVTFILFLFCNLVFGQMVFQKTYGGLSMDLGYSGQATNDGGFIITGTSWSFGINGDVYLLKTDSAGNIQWMKNYGGNFSDEGSSVQQTADGGYIVAGATTISNAAYSGKVFLIKTDSNGDTLWTKMYGSSTTDYWGNFVRQTSDHGYIISAGDDNGTYGSSHLIRIDSAGNFLWAYEYGTSIISINSVFETSDGGFITVMPGWSSFLIKTSFNGTVSWTKRLTNFNPNYAYFLNTLGKTNDGGFILAGEYRYTGGILGCYLVKTDSSGDTLWTKAYQYLAQASAISVQQTSDGGYALAGFAKDSISGGHSNAFVLRTDSTGNVIWMRKYGGAVNDEADYIQQTFDGGFIIAGYSESFGAGSYDIYLIKTDSAGNSGCNDSLLNPVVIVPYVEFGTSNLSGANPLAASSPSTIIGSIVPQQTVLCSSFVSITENAFNNNIKISPNPFTSDITITLQKQNVKQASFTVKNILGQTVLRQERKAPLPTGEGQGVGLNLSFLSKGIYLLDITVNGERTVKKIVKE